MRRSALLVLLLPLLLVPGRTTLAAWTDPEPPSTSTDLASVSLSAPTLTCTNVDVLNGLGLRLFTKAVLTWSAFTTPVTGVTLTYGADVVGAGLATLNINTSGVTRTTEITPSLLGSLLGGTKTVRVTGTLPLTTWTTSTDIQLTYSVAGLSVTCP